jgi:negative regulator of flagellin synthesis FlgM
VEAYNQIMQINRPQSAKNVKAPKSTMPSMGKDEVQISSMGRSLQVAKQAVSEASDIREDKVAEMKQKLASDNYQVDTGDFASKLLEKYNAAIL